MPVPRSRSTVDSILAVSMVAAALEPMTMSPKHSYPCDTGTCPFGEGGGMYFCRDNCGLGVDEDSDGGEY
jgi:hypothetical protein